MLNEKSSLWDLMDQELKRLKYGNSSWSAESVLKDDKSSAKFIREILQDDDFHDVDKDSEIYTLAEARARHSAITFLMGLVFRKFGGIFSMLSDAAPVEAEDKKSHEDLGFQLWLITSLYHDKGYFSTRLQDENLAYEKLVKEYFLLTDQYQKEKLTCLNQFSEKYGHFFAHTYEQVLCYDRYARDYHTRNAMEDEQKAKKSKSGSGKKEVHERIDHGILGGFLVFHDLAKKAEKGNASAANFNLIKAASMTIAQHNIFKSIDPEGDANYEKYGLGYLKHDGGFFVTEETPLLLLLCLVDTLECVKKFSKGENEDNSLVTKTVLRSIMLSVETDRLEIDFSTLHKKVEEKKNKDFSKKYTKYRKAVMDFGTWTAFEARETTGNLDQITITLAEMRSGKIPREFGIL